MKKSKIIIPAAAILALSVGASVTGTVAWFTASRTQTVSATNLAAVNAAGDLKVTVSAGHATTKKGEKSIELSYLKDVSLAVTNDNLRGFVPVIDQVGDNFNITATRQLTTAELKSYSSVSVDPAKYDDNVDGKINVYYYCSWTAKFETSSNAANYLLFDTSKSSISSTNDNSIYNALRISMTTSEKNIVWAPKTTLSESEVYYVNEAATLKTPVSATVAPDFSTYVKEGDTSILGKYEGAFKTATKINDGDSKGNADTNAGLLSTNLKNGTPTTVKFTVWFEGIDPSCITSGIAEISDNTSKIVKDLALSFYAVDSTTFID